MYLHVPPVVMYLLAQSAGPVVAQHAAGLQQLAQDHAL
jgi:hypothetical protein